LILLPPNFDQPKSVTEQMMSKLGNQLLFSHIESSLKFYESMRISELREIARKQQGWHSDPIPEPPPISIRKPKRYKRYP
jgi:hypothetical protein